MSTEYLSVVLQGVAAAGMLLAAAGSFVGVLISLRNGRKANNIAAKTDDAQTILKEIKVTINGRLDELLATTRALAHIEGAAAARSIDRIDPAVTAAAMLRAAKDLAEQPKPEPT